LVLNPDNKGAQVLHQFVRQFKELLYMYIASASAYLSIFPAVLLLADDMPLSSSFVRATADTSRLLVCSTM
jgi:hypothetical protein